MQFSAKRAGAKIPLKTVLADGRILDYPRLRLMGVINITPDSFYSGSRAATADAALRAAGKMLEDGADILDIGGESTRPGAAFVDEKTEIARVTGAIRAIRKRFPRAIISIDTYKAAAAASAIDCGADIVNDISAVSFDPGMAETVRKANVPLVLMHTRGAPREMQKNAVYADAAGEVRDYLKKRLAFARQCGIKPEKIILDPGLGFAKLPEHNLAILRRIEEFTRLGAPVLVGASRKSFIGIALGSKDAPLPPEKRLEGTLAVTAWLAARGVHIARVHDIAENAAVVRVTSVICR